MTAQISSSQAYRPAAQPRPGGIARWLVGVALLVFLMVVIGGITRLTESGLSMVRWEPISGIVPPLNAEQWQAEFDAYRATPEYRQVNRGMSLGDFKRIFFWEYVHRVLGRLIGIAFAVPLAWFAWRRAIPPGYGWRLTALLALGGLQGAIGWWMVASGLMDRPDVSHVRLAVHLLAALLIFAGLIWTALDLRLLRRDLEARPARMRGVAAAALAMLAVQMLFGALTAGLDAGHAYASWPKMGDQWFPAGGWRGDWPPLKNLIDNPIVVQFVHRWMAWIAAGAAVLLALRVWRLGSRKIPRAIAVLLATQIVLGVATLLSGVHIAVAVAHQAVAVLLLAALTAAAHRVGSACR